MVKILFQRDVLITLISTVIGFALGVLVSIYFYDKSNDDNREELLNAAISDIQDWKNKEIYPQLYDSVKYCTSGKPWPKLTTLGIEQLARDIHRFEHSISYDSLKQLVSKCKIESESFNNRLEIRNFSILFSFNLPGITTQMSPRAYNYYHTFVLPKAEKLYDYLSIYREELID